MEEQKLKNMTDVIKAEATHTQICSIIQDFAACLNDNITYLHDKLVNKDI